MYIVRILNSVNPTLVSDELYDASIGVLNKHPEKYNYSNKSYRDGFRWLSFIWLDVDGKHYTTKTVDTEV
jgi:hypothetical protein